MAKKNKQETAPEQDGAVLKQKPVAENETVIEEVIKEMPIIDYERKNAEKRVSEGKPAYEEKVSDETHEEKAE